MAAAAALAVPACPRPAPSPRRSVPLTGRATGWTVPPMSISIERPAGSGGAPARNWWQAMARGLRRRCPACGRGAMYHRYLKVTDACPVCGTELHHHRADDAPPYFTMLVVGHVVVGGVLGLERALAPPVWLHMALWLPLTLALSLWLLPMVKGGLIGLQWALGMHGFAARTSAVPDPAGPDPIPTPSNGTRAR